MLGTSQPGPRFSQTAPVDIKSDEPARQLRATLHHHLKTYPRAGRARRGGLARLRGCRSELTVFPPSAAGLSEDTTVRDMALRSNGSQSSGSLWQLRAAREDQEYAEWMQGLSVMGETLVSDS